MQAQPIEKLLAERLDCLQNRCNLTGSAFNFHGAGADKNLLPSLNRIDSNGHDEDYNLQVACQFISFRTQIIVPFGIRTALLAGVARAANDPEICNRMERTGSGKHGIRLADLKMKSSQTLIQNSHICSKCETKAHSGLTISCSATRSIRRGMRRNLRSMVRDLRIRQPLNRRHRSSLSSVFNYLISIGPLYAAL